MTDVLIKVNSNKDSRKGKRGWMDNDPKAFQ